MSLTSRSSPFSSASSASGSSKSLGSASMPCGYPMTRRCEPASGRMPAVGSVVITRRLPGSAVEALAEHGHTVAVWPGEMPPTPTELRELVVAAEGLLCLLTDRIDEALLDA